VILKVYDICLNFVCLVDPAIKSFTPSLGGQSNRPKKLKIPKKLLKRENIKKPCVFANMKKTVPHHINLVVFFRKPSKPTKKEIKSLYMEGTFAKMAI